MAAKPLQGPALIGLTGGIASGKSSVASQLEKHFIPVFDADQAVHRLYAPLGKAVAPILAAFGDVRDEKGGIDREKLSQALKKAPENFKKLEDIVHPLVRDEEKVFLEKAIAAKAPYVVFDIPLIFETGSEGRFDLVIVVSASEETQRARALKRPNMDEEKLNRIMERQMGVDEKIRRADLVINGDQPLADMFSDVDDLIHELDERLGARKTP